MSDNENTANDTNNSNPTEETERVVNKAPIKKQLKPETKSKRIRVRNFEIKTPFSLSLDTVEEARTDIGTSEQKATANRLFSHEDIAVHERLLEFSRRPTIIDTDVIENSINKSVTVGPPFVCQFCHNWFFKRGKLTVHYITNHKCEHCNLCNLLFENITEKMHHDNKHHFPIECEVCSKSFKDNWLLNEHYENEHDTISCLFCGILIQPKPFYVNHIRRKHVVHDQYFESGDGLKIVDNWDAKWIFRCRLCNKERKKIDFFGHFTMHHKITVSCFIQLLFSENITIDIEGNSSEDLPNRIISEDVALDCSVGKSLLDEVVCKICMKKDLIIPFEFHKLFCSREIGCKHCLDTFENEEIRNLHIEKNHSDFKCSLGCNRVNFPNETQLDSHYNKFHDIVPCRYCDIFVSAANDKYEHHLKTQHNYKAIIMKKSSNDFLFRCIKRDNKNTVICCMCDKSLTDLTDNIEAIYLHYAQDHFVTMKSIFSLISPNSFPIKESKTKPKSPNRREQTEKEECSCVGECECKNNKKTPSDENVRQKSKKETSGKEKQESDSDSEQEHDNEAAKDPTVNYEAFIDMDPSEVQCFIDETSNDELSEDENEPDPELIIIKNEPIDESDNEADEENDSYKKLERNHPLANVKKDSSDKKYNCDMCAEKYAKKRELLEHSNTVHGFVVNLGPLNCIECTETFSNESIFERHLINRHGRGIILNENRERIHTCSFCNFIGSKKITRKHIREEHAADIEEGKANKMLGFKCRFCDRCFWGTETRNSHEIGEHSVQNSDDFFKCFVCYQVYSSKICLKRHVHSRHTLEPKYRHYYISYKCLKCSVLLPGIEEARSHFAMQHPTLKILRCTVSGCNARLKTKKTFGIHIKNIHMNKKKSFEGPSSCELCGKWLTNSRSATTHYRMKHGQDTKVGFGCRLCKMRFDTVEKRKLHYSQAHSGVAAYECPECGKGFNSKSGLYGHKQLHMNNSFECQYCKKTFVRRDTYNEHLLIHSGPRHQCPFCPRSFTQRSNLTRHTRIHTGQKPYECTWCPKRFSDKGACNSHIRVHTREEESQCPYCNKTFSKKQKLNYHIRKHTGEGLLPCPTCGKEFTNSFSLKEHREIHETSTQLLCGQCGRGFSHDRYLRRHMIAMHTVNGRRYSCPFCEKKFVAQNQLNLHVMTHTGVKHIQCLLCDMAYSSRKSVLRHLEQVHEITVSNEEESKYIHQMTPEEAGLLIPGQEDNSDGESPTMVPVKTAGISLADALKLTEFKTIIEEDDHINSLLNRNTLKSSTKFSHKTKKQNKKYKKKKDYSSDDDDYEVRLFSDKQIETKSRKIKKPKRYSEECLQNELMEMKNKKKPKRNIDLENSDIDEDVIKKVAKSRKTKKPKRVTPKINDPTVSVNDFEHITINPDVEVKLEPEDELSDEYN